MTNSNSDPCDSEAIHRLLSALVDGELSAADLAGLEAQLLASPAARAEYREFMCVEALLAWSTTTGVTTVVSDSRPPQAWRQPRAALWLGLVTAATLAAGLAVFAWIPTVIRPPAAVFLSATDAAVWHGGRDLAIGQPVGDGPLRLERGSAQITFPSGAVVALRAGAEVEVLGRNRLFLRSGQVTPYVPAEAKGFTVVSPGGEVVDYGTEFSVTVGSRGETDVFVIDGEVGVTSGHSSRDHEVRLTQGFGTQMSMADSGPVVTQQPLLVDHFTTPDGPLVRRDVDPGQESQVSDGVLRIPIDRTSQKARVVLDHDFTSLVGRRSAISFRAMLPGNGKVALGRWLALVIDSGDGPPPMAFEPRAAVAVLMSPMWQAGLRIEGQAVESKEIFPRSRGIEGPYQVVLTIDDTPEARATHGSAVITLMINGLEFVAQRPFRLGERPRLVLQTNVTKQTGADGEAIIDDLSVSVVTD
jgi:ferric-dicitrate binding protein FerR (iron transport regulator)